MIDLEKGQLSEIKKTLERYVPEYEVRVFGSRIQGKAKPFSDLDLAILGKKKLDEAAIEALKDNFSQSDLPIIIDIVEWTGLSEAFKKIIDQQFEIIQECPR